MFEIRLTAPPGVNNLYPTNRRTGKRVPSAKYVSWKKANWLAPRGLKPVPGPFSVVATFDRKDRRKRDLDSLIKAPLDFLTQNGLIDDDCLADEIILRWSSPSCAPVYVKEPMMIMQITEMPQ